MKPDRFITFLKESGAEILETTNPYEVVRFRTVNGVSVMYKGRRGFSFTGDAAEAYKKFETKDIWRIRTNGQKIKDRIKEDLIERDGKLCFFCGKDGFMTIEHLLPVADGGNNNMKNLCLACKSCNVSVGNMSIIEKIFYRESLSEKNDVK